MISVTILTKNSCQHLREVLSSLAQFDEVLLYDNGSEDETLAIAEEYPNVTIHKGDFEGFGETHNKASSLAKHDWILSIDSDEVVTPEMAEEIFSTKLDPKTAYSFPRDNYYNGKWIKWCGWYPDRQIRLYHRKNTSFSSAKVHEKILTEAVTCTPMKGSIRHYSYTSTEDFLAKMQAYSALFAEQNKGIKKSSFFSAFSHAFFAFFKSYFIKRGFLGGKEGFIISLYNSNTAFYKYLKLWEVNTHKGKPFCE